MNTLVMRSLKTAPINSLDFLTFSGQPLRRKLPKASSETWLGYPEAGSSLSEAGLGLPEADSGLSKAGTCFPEAGKGLPEAGLGLGGGMYGHMDKWTYRFPH